MTLKKKLKFWINHSLFPFCIVKIGKPLMRLLLSTCRWDIQGLEQFKSIAQKQSCLLVLWHNRLAIAPNILHRYASEFFYAALVSNSRDGKILSKIVHSYETGRTISVPHDARSQALKTLIQYLQTKREVVVITPDGPRGPLYEVKPGAALAALETGVPLITLNWNSSRMWTLKTWDQLRIPKPFSKISVTFEKPIFFEKGKVNLDEVQKKIQQKLSF